jgi:uncharacterized membrane protein
MQKHPLFTREQKYRLALFGLLVTSSVISIGLFVARAAPSPNGPYTSLILNLFLAWIPFGLAWIAYVSTHLPKAIMIGVFSLCAVLWLLFFPNAPYILTDFQHLAVKDTNTPTWYDVIMLLWFAWDGLFLGLFSLYFMQKIIEGWMGKISGWVFVVGVSFLGSLGVYLGRFLYWNSWDLLTDPLSLRGSFVESFSYGPYQERTLVFSIFFTLFFIFTYLIIYIFGQLLHEHDRKS